MDIMGLQADLQRPEYQQEAPTASHLPILAENAANHPPEPCLVQRHYLHSSAPWVFVSCSNHGLGDP